jgi:hypothetical protein
LQWNRLGNYNQSLLKIISKSSSIYNTFQTNKKLYLQNVNFLIEIDFKNNKIRSFENNNIFTYSKPYFDSNSNSLVYLQSLTGSSKLKLETISLSDLLKNPVKTEKLYYSSWQEYALPLVSIVMMLLLFIGVYKWIVSQKGKCFVFHQSKNKFYYKTKIISNLDPMEEKILAYLFQNKKNYIQLNQLNFFFEKESPDNFTNVIKKRDLVFSSLVVKLNAILNQEEKSLVLMQKNESDKRIKEIKLNPMYFTLK